MGAKGVQTPIQKASEMHLHQLVVCSAAGRQRCTRAKYNVMIVLLLWQIVVGNFQMQKTILCVFYIGRRLR